MESFKIPMLSCEQHHRQFGALANVGEIIIKLVGVLRIQRVGMTEEQTIDADRFGISGHLDDIVKMARDAEAIGVDGLLLGHPNSLYPKDADQLYDYLAYVCERTELAMVLFAAQHWNFERLHPSGYPPHVLTRAADIANV